MHKPTIHNPTNFNPLDYEINGYFDNQVPRHIFGMPKEKWEETVQQWELERDELFPEHNDQRCQHCGQSNVRFVVSCLHIPSKKNVCFGDICIARMGFPNYDAFQAARVRANAAAKAKEYKLGLKREQFLSAHPELQTALDKFNNDPKKYANNFFAHKIVSSFNQWANLTEKQIAAFVKSLNWENRWEKIKEDQRKNSNWVGKIGERIELTATIKYYKIFDDRPSKFGYGPSQLTVLEDNSGNVFTYWNHLGQKDETITFKATIKKHAERDGVKQTVLSRAHLAK